MKYILGERVNRDCGFIYIFDKKSFDLTTIPKKTAFKNCSNIYIYIYIYIFSNQDFLSRALTTNRIAGERRGPSFIPLFTSTRSRTFKNLFWNFARQMTITYFSSHCLYLQGCYSMTFTNLSNYYLID